MALIKKIDVEKHFAARRAMRLGRIWPVSSPDRAGTAVAGKATNAPRLIDNRLPEKVSQGVSSPLIPIVSDFGRNRLLRPPGIRQV
jgi:hypothetical protein